MLFFLCAFNNMMNSAPWTVTVLQACKLTHKWQLTAQRQICCQSGLEYDYCVDSSGDIEAGCKLCSKTLSNTVCLSLYYHWQVSLWTCLSLLIKCGLNLTHNYRQTKSDYSNNTQSVVNFTFLFLLHPINLFWFTNIKVIQHINWQDMTCSSCKMSW